LCCGLSVNLGWVDLISFRHVLHQGAEGVDHQLAILNAVVCLDDGSMLGLEARVRFDDDREPCWNSCCAFAFE
jgi:hypothetical protein